MLFTLPDFDDGRKLFDKAIGTACRGSPRIKGKANASYGIHHRKLSGTATGSGRLNV